MAQSDCYIATVALTDRLASLFASISEWSYTTAIDPIMYSNQLLVDLSSLMEACSTLTLIKQFTTRTSNLSGVLDFVFTVSYDIIGNSNEMSQVKVIMDSSSTCYDTGFALGSIVSEAFNYQAPYYDTSKAVASLDVSAVNTTTSA